MIGRNPAVCSFRQDRDRLNGEINFCIFAAIMGNNANNTRKVLKYYTYSFLDKNMYMCMSLMLVFYSLWSVDELTLHNLSTKQLVWTVPLVIIIAMRYSMNIEKKGEECRIDGDPVEVLLGDKVLLGLGGLLVLIIFFFIYF